MRGIEQDMTLVFGAKCYRNCNMGIVQFHRNDYNLEAKFFAAIQTTTVINYKLRPPLGKL